MKLIKPKKLRKGSRVAAITLSWGGAGKFPWRYEAGKKQFEEEFGCEVMPTKHALKSPEWIYENPKARAEDLMEAFADPTIDGIIAMIGGEESIRILPFIDLDLIRGNPKVFMGYSDTTVAHAICFKAGLSSFYGPAFMSGLAENTGMFPYLVNSLRKTLFSSEPIGLLEENTEGWTVEHYDWGEPENQSIKRGVQPCSGWKYHQDKGSVTGQLFGGCFEVLDFLRGIEFHPTADELEGAILFLEGSEEAPSPVVLERFLRSLGAMGILHKINGLLLGRPGGNMPVDQFAEYDAAVLKVLRGELELDHIPVVTHMDFGHTDPFMTMPIGVSCTIDSEKKQVIINEASVVD